MAAAVFNSSFGTLLCTLSTRHLDPAASCESPFQAPWQSRTLHIACTTLGVSAFATIMHSRTLARTAHSIKSPVRVEQVYPCRICQRAASLKNPARLGFSWPFRSLQAHLPESQTLPCRPPPLQSVPLLSAARLLPFRRSLRPSCACLMLPVLRVVFLSGRPGRASVAVQQCMTQFGLYSDFKMTPQEVKRVANLLEWTTVLEVMIKCRRADLAFRTTKQERWNQQAQDRQSHKDFLEEHRGTGKFSGKYAPQLQQTELIWTMPWGCWIKLEDKDVHCKE